MRVLVACEESQAVTIAFRAKGHEAFSADIQPCSGGHPEWHIQGDATSLLDDGWDLLIAHPPCTYLSNAGARFLFAGGEGKLNQSRYQLGLEGKEFFLKFWNSTIPRICIENPIPSTVFALPPYDQIIQPFHFGHPVQKKTGLWLRGLHPLVATINLGDGESSRKARWYNGKRPTEEPLQDLPRDRRGHGPAVGRGLHS
jgi:hypothetical protein